MKTLKRILPLMLAVFIVCFACQNGDEIPSNLPGSVQFSFENLTREAEERQLRKVS